MVTEWTKERHEAAAAQAKKCKDRFQLINYDDVDQCADSLTNALAEIERLQTPYCMGRGTIQLVAKEGQAIVAGKAFIAADDLLHKDPYAEIERLTRVAEAADALRTGGDRFAITRLNDALIAWREGK